MTDQEFDEILLKPESDILDFKREQYDILRKSNEANHSKFIKDIISFCNTIRTESAYIILGVGENQNGEKDLIGINMHVDDAILQEKIKNKVTPIPHFCYYTKKVNDKTFGIIEIPIRKYEEPIFPTVKMKGLETGKVYCRRNSSNSEATGREIIQISRWLDSIPSQISHVNINDEIAEIIARTTTKLLPLSEQIAESLKLARKYNLKELEWFCLGELSGWSDTEKIDVEGVLSYRINDVVMTPNEIKVNPYSFHSLTSQQLLDEIKEIDKAASEQPLFLPHSITQLEEYIDGFPTDKDNSLIILTQSADVLFDNPKLAGRTIKFYVSKQNLKTIYQRIRQKLIRNLLDIK
ncbi:helix-turn-helix domain-containing protein [uncultured Draconibacterium sp.]|uniref:AlbA family DNA-binding domain-containing protein n=1 Tax=uncultured Draconibacterium sp. TaxID=1573823 RepID=UPI0025EA59A6|nr:ATP-binding protein [uncultured Draconibacterium sp.]